MKTKTPKIEDLLAAGVHFGHQVRRWHPKMEQYIFTVKKNIHIIDLEITEQNLNASAEYLYEVAKKGGQIIFVGTKKQVREIVELEAKRCGALYVTERWIGGTITNFKVIKKNIDKLLTLIKRRETGDLEKYTKKERLLIDREIDKLQKNVGGIAMLKGTPAAVVVIDTKRERTVIAEANRFNVPIVALVDTNSDPSGVQYVIPGNDDAIKSVVVILQTLGNAVEEGYKDFEAAKRESEKPVEPLMPKKLDVLPEPVDAGLTISGSEKSEIEVKDLPKVLEEIAAEPKAPVKIADALSEKAPDTTKTKKSKVKKETK